MSLDLHLHSTFSDGTLTPTALVRLAKAKGLAGISITDHDTTEGTAEALSAGETMGIEVVPGIEMSVVHNDLHLHLLGYYINHDSEELQSMLQQIQMARSRRNTEIIDRLQHLGLNVSVAEVQQKSTVGQTGRPHMAQVLVEKGLVGSMDEAFARFLGRGAAAYVPRQILPVTEGISLIVQAGGIPVLAHPATIDNSLRKIPALVEQLVPLGLGGLEVYYPVHTSKNQKQLTGLAARYGLVVTGGSDYHGDIRPGTMLAGGKNVYVPRNVLDMLKERRGIQAARQQHDER